MNMKILNEAKERIFGYVQYVIIRLIVMICVIQRTVTEYHIDLFASDAESGLCPKDMMGNTIQRLMSRLMRIISKD